MLGLAILLLTIILLSRHITIVETEIEIVTETGEVIEMNVGTAGIIVMTVEVAIETGIETVMIVETGAK